MDLRGKSFANEDLSGAEFKGSILKNCNFSGCDLSFANFSGADLYKADFTNSRLYVTLFRGTDLTRANFNGADLYGIKLFDADITDVQFDKIISTERKAKSPKDYERAAEVYNILKRVIKEHGEYGIAAHYYYRQRVCKRNSKHNRFARVFELIFLDWFIGYGEKPVRSIYWSMLWILLFSITYLIIPLFGLGILSNINDGILEELSTIYHIFFTIEFSISAFIGADLSGWGMNGIVRFLASLETLIGIIMIAITFIGFVRKIVRD